MRTYEKNITTGVIREYAYLNNQIIGWQETDSTGNSVKRYAATDLLGSVTTVTDESGKVLWSGEYTAFGNVAYGSGDVLYDGMYTGKDIDSETGLTYHWNRWRSEDGSSFISEDPARDGSNWYGYCGNNPINSTDPTGLVAYGPNGPYNTEEEKANYKSEWRTSVPTQTDDTTTPTNPEIPLPKFLDSFLKFFKINTDSTTDSAFSRFTAEKIREILATKYFINDKSGNLIKLYGIDMNNPVLKDLMKQTDPRLSSIPEIGKWGCNFMAVLGYAQMTVGQTLSAEQIISIWNEAVKNPSIMEKESTVANPDLLANMALTQLGRSDIGLTFNWQPPNVVSTAIGVRTVVPFGLKEHYIARDLFGNTIYNSGNTDGISTKEATVYVHAK